MKSSFQYRHAAFTLLELMATTAMLALLGTACMSLLRTSYTAWNRHEVDQEARQRGIAVLRHIVRHVRQAGSVTAISGPTDSSGSLSLQMESGDTFVWEHDAVNKQVLFGVTTATELLATGVEELTFVGVRTDGWSTTTDVDLIHSIKATTKVAIDRPGGSEDFVVSCQAWFRSW